MALKKTYLFIIAVTYTAGITTLSLMPLSDKVVKESPVSDKFVHFTFYTVFSILWLLYLDAKKTQSKYKYLKIFITVFVYGMIIECLQYLMPYNRHFDMTDVFFNLCGSLLGIIIMMVAFTIKKHKTGKFNCY